MLEINVKICARAMKKTAELFGSHHHIPKWHESLLPHISFKNRLDIDAMGKAVL